MHVFDSVPLNSQHFSKVSNSNVVKVVPALPGQQERAPFRVDVGERSPGGHC